MRGSTVRDSIARGSTVRGSIGRGTAVRDSTPRGATDDGGGVEPENADAGGGAGRVAADGVARDGVETAVPDEGNGAIRGFVTA
jgi:hypothetical protein